MTKDEEQANSPKVVGITPDDVTEAAAALIEQSMRIAEQAEKGGPIHIDVENRDHHPGEYVEFFRSGWRFKDLRLYEEAMSTSNLAEIVCRRIQDWKLTVDGESIPFKPAGLRKQLADLPKDADEREFKRLENRIEASYHEAIDELEPYLSSWLWAAYRTAYNVAGALGPNA